MKLLETAATLCSLVALAPAPGLAQGTAGYEEGMRRFADLDYDGARPHLAAAKVDESLPVAVRANAAMNLAIILLSTGDETAARRNISEALILEPSTKPPVGSSPTMTKLVNEERAALGINPATSPNAAAGDEAVVSPAHKPDEPTPGALTPPETTTSESVPVYRSPWLWAGAGAVVIATAAVLTIVFWPHGVDCDASAGQGCLSVKVNR